MSDPYYANVVLSLPFRGADYSTTFTDLSASPKTPATIAGNTRISTASYVFYGSSLYLDGSGDYLSYSYGTYFDLSAADFTIECYFKYISSSTNYGSIVSKRTSGTDFDYQLFINKPSNVIAFSWGDTNNSRRDMSAAIVVNTYYHVALTREGSQLRLFLDGVLKDSATISGSLRNRSTSLEIGKSLSYSDSYFGGYVQDLRITKGTARYTADFTPPSPIALKIAGTIFDINGLPCARQIYVYSAASGALLGSTISNASTGFYEVFAPSIAEVFRVVVANEATLYNDLIDRAIPE